MFENPPSTTTPASSALPCVRAATSGADSEQALTITQANVWWRVKVVIIRSLMIN
jgi:hypothetical protein